MAQTDEMQTDPVVNASQPMELSSYGTSRDERIDLDIDLEDDDLSSVSDDMEDDCTIDLDEDD